MYRTCGQTTLFLLLVVIVVSPRGWERTLLTLQDSIVWTTQSCCVRTDEAELLWSVLTSSSIDIYIYCCRKVYDPLDEPASFRSCLDYNWFPITSFRLLLYRWTCLLFKMKHYTSNIHSNRKPSEQLWQGSVNRGYSTGKHVENCPSCGYFGINRNTLHVYVGCGPKTKTL